MHPSEEEWVEYLYGETSAESHKEMTAHLESCGECRARLSEWRGVMKQLDSWRLPRARVRSLRLLTALRWAAAAAVLMAVGFGVGRLWAVPTLDAAALRASLEASISQSLREDLAAEYRASNEAFRAELADELYRPVVAAVQSLGAQTAAAGQSVVALAEAVDAARAEDRLAVAAAFEELESRRTTDYARLNNDLYVLAAATSDEILHNRGSIAELAAHALEAEAARTGDAADSQDERSQQ